MPVYFIKPLFFLFFEPENVLTLSHKDVNMHLLEQKLERILIILV